MRSPIFDYVYLKSSKTTLQHYNKLAGFSLTSCASGRAMEMSF